MKRSVAISVLLLAVLPACVSPSRTQQDYRRKAANAAESMVSVVESARLTAELASSDRAPGPYVSLRMSESEDDAEWIITSFATVQPPDNAAEALRDDLLVVLEEANGVITELRIRAYRGELSSLRDVADPLAELATRLQTFERSGET